MPKVHDNTCSPVNMPEHPVQHRHVEIPAPMPLEEVPETVRMNLPRIGASAVGLFALLAVGLLAGLFMLGYLPHRRLQNELRAGIATAASSKSLVRASLPRRQAQATDLLLPADVEAFQQTSIFPRANGYLKRLRVDIGDRVQAGQLLAEIDTPELDAQLNQARAAVQQAQAGIVKAQSNVTLADTTYRRYSDVLAGGVSDQDRDEKRAQLDQAKADLKVATANESAAKAEVQRLEAMQGFKNVTAPFAGVITARNYDVGALMSSSSTTTTKELFQLDQTNPLRVFVKVPQSHAAGIQQGQPAELLVRNYPGRAFAGSITRSAGSIDSATRTLRVEIDVTNADNLLFAGMYGQVRLRANQQQPPLLVPSSALIYNADGLSLAVAREGRVHFQKVAAGRDLGVEIEILEGLSDHDQVISDPSEQLKEGMEVELAPMSQPQT